jgi:hypothetical protein
MCTLQKFCVDCKLPDLTPLISPDIPAPDRYAVMWQLMQLSLPARKQVDFLRGFCAGSRHAALKSFELFLKGPIDAEQCKSGMDLIQTVVGDDAGLGVAMKSFCSANSLDGVAAFIGATGREEVVYGIQTLIRVPAKMQVPLDQLKFGANPLRFAQDLDRLVEEQNAAFSLKKAALESSLRSLQTVGGELKQQLAQRKAPLGPGEKRARS